MRTVTNDYDVYCNYYADSVIKLFKSESEKLCLYIMLSAGGFILCKSYFH